MSVHIKMSRRGLTFEFDAEPEKAGRIVSYIVQGSSLPEKKTRSRR